MDENTKKILKAKKNKDYRLVQQLQQELDTLRKLEDKPDMEDFPKFQKILNTMYMTFCKKQFDYGPGNIAMGASLKNEEEINMALLGIIVRLNDKINRLVNLSTKHNFKAKNEPIEDAFLDIAIYGVMALIVKNQKWGK